MKLSVSLYISGIFLLPACVLTIPYIFPCFFAFDITYMSSERYCISDRLSLPVTVQCIVVERSSECPSLGSDEITRILLLLTTVSRPLSSAHSFTYSSILSVLQLSPRAEHASSYCDASSSSVVGMFSASSFFEVHPDIIITDNERKSMRILPVICFIFYPTVFFMVYLYSKIHYNSNTIVC